MRITWTKEEWGALTLSAIILGLVFGFDDKRATFELSYWLTNFFMMLVLSFLLLGLYVGAQKYAAARFKTKTVLKTWSIKRVGFRKGAHAKHSFPVGIFLPVMIAFLSRGNLPFVGATETGMAQRQEHRLGRKYPFVNDFDVARILVTGPLVLTIIGLLTKAFASTMPLLSTISWMAMAIAMSNMLPLPKLDGFSVFMGSSPLYIFSSVFILAAFLLSKMLNLGLSIALSLVLAVFMLIVYYHNA